MILVTDISHRDYESCLSCGYDNTRPGDEDSNIPLFEVEIARLRSPRKLKVTLCRDCLIDLKKQIAGK